MAHESQAAIQVNIQKISSLKYIGAPSVKVNNYQLTYLKLAMRVLWQHARIHIINNNSILPENIL